MAFPIPRAAPVTRLTLPVRSLFMPPSRMDPRGRVLDGLGERTKEPGGGSAVDDPVVERQAQGDLVSRHDRVADHGGPPGDPSDPEDRTFGRVNDRREGVNSVGP